MSISDLLLIAQLVMFPLPEFSPEEIARLEKIKPGEQICKHVPAGDGCNTCSVCYVRTGHDTVREVPGTTCTTMGCARPEIKFK